MVLVSIYCQFGVLTSVSESESAASSVLQMTGKTATVQYKSVTSLADNKSALALWSHMATIKFHMQYPIFMPCTGAAVISLTSYPYIV